MKKLLALIVCALLAFTLASCVHIHTKEIDEAVAPTCTESGLTEGKHCSECGKVLVKQEIIEAKGHILVNGKCENCDYTYSLGLKFTSNGDGTCYVSGIGTCSDTEVVIPETSPDGDRVIAIGNEAFRWCTSFTSIVIPASVTSIGELAFNRCTSLTSIVIPASVTEIGSCAFNYCTSLSEIKVADGNTNYKDIDGNLYSYDGTELIQYAVGKTDYTFIIPTSVTSIGNGAFCACKSLTSIEIPASVTSICNEAFFYCESLTSVTFAEGSQLTSVGSYAFYSCSSLTSIVIPANVTSIGEGAFYNCYLLTSIVIPANVTSIGYYAFYNCSKLTDVYYACTKAQWTKILFGYNNEDLLFATIHYNYIPEE